MARLMIAAKEHGTHAVFRTRKGDIIQVDASGSPKGNKALLPNYVYVDIPDATIAELLGVANRWNRTIDWEVVNQNVPQDKWRLRIFATNNGNLSEKGDITRAMIESWFIGYNITVQSASRNSVTIDVDIYQVAISEGFWKRFNFTDVVFTKLDFDSGTRIHRIQVDYTLKDFNPQNIELNIMKWGTVISHFNKVLVFDIDSQDIRLEMKRRISAQLDDPIDKFQLRIDEADVDLIIGAGGEITRTKAEIVAFIKNKADE